MATVAVLTTIFLLYGHVTVSKPMASQGIRIAVVQGNVEQARKWDPRYAESIMETYAHLTRKASNGAPALIIWPETATPRAINRDLDLYSQVMRIAEDAGSYILLGSSQRKFFKYGSKGVKYLNSAYLIPPKAGVATNQRYDKIRLLPFGEYLPLNGVIPWSYINIPNVARCIPGRKFTIFELPAFRFGVTICWESIFPALVRQFVKRGAQFIVNITNEAWFGKTPAPYQFVSMNVFRAVENRVYVVRCANTGVSCFIDPYGRIVDRVKDGMGQDIFVRGVLSGLVTPLNSRTFYTRYGDWLAWLCFPCSVAFLLVAFVRKNPGLPPPPEETAIRRSRGSG